jgi:uncharacterized protein (DUF58 family)
MRPYQTVFLRAKDDVYTHLQGGNFSKLLGQGYDFSELRVYATGDDIRHISWINSAKSNELLVKKMHEERELLVHVELMFDGRSVIGQKRELMSYVFAVLAYSAVHHNNLFEASIALGDGFEYFNAFKDLEGIEPILDSIAHLEVLGVSSSYAQVQEKLLRLHEQKSLCFVVGDFLDEVDLSVLAQKHQVCVIMVRDRWEENPTSSAEVQLMNPMTNQPIAKNLSKKVSKQYQQKLQEHDAKLYAHFNKYGIRYIKVYEIDEVLRKLDSLFDFNE